MGLRIIDRHRPAPPPEVSEQDLTDGLKAATSLRPLANGEAAAERQAQFLEHFRRVKARITTPEGVTACAERVREHLATYRQNSSEPHKHVDIATLLELL